MTLSADKTKIKKDFFEATLPFIFILAFESKYQIMNSQKSFGSFVLEPIREECRGLNFGGQIKQISFIFAYDGTKHNDQSKVRLLSDSFI